MLTADDLPEAELCSALLDGELYRLGPSFCAVDEFDGPIQRARALAAGLPERMIAERFSVVWVLGLTISAPYPLQLCARSHARWNPFGNAEWSVREVVIDDAELLQLGGLWLTTPLRTAVDIARVSKDWTPAERDAILGLADLGGFTLDDCCSLMDRRNNLPGKQRARQRLEMAMR